MRKVVFFALFAFLLFSSFTVTNNSTAIYSSKNIKGKGGVAWRIDKTEPYLEDLDISLCNEGLIFFTQSINIHWDLHGVQNKNVTIVQGKISFSGTSDNYGTNEVFTIETLQTKTVDIDIHVKGTSVFTRRGEIRLVGSAGTVYERDYFIHYTINPLVEVTTNKVVISDNCQ